MSSLNGFRFDITGASGSQGLLTPKSGWKVYVLPRGGHASQDSTGTLITFDSASVASRFAVGDWIQAGLLTANIRQVSAVGGNSISVSGSALTVTENDRIFLIGTTQPTVSGGSATYIPNTLVRKRDDDGGDLYANSLITSNSDGLIQGWAGVNYYDCLIQDGNNSLQGSIVDLPVGSVGGISTDGPAIFGHTATFNAGVSFTGWVHFGSTVTMHAQLGVTGHATFGSTITGHANAGFTGNIVVGGSATIGSRLAVTGPALFGASATVNGQFGVTGLATFGTTIAGTSNMNITGLAHITGMPRAKVKSSTGLFPITTGVLTEIGLETDSSSNCFDVGDMWVTGSSKFLTVPAYGPGLYHVVGQVDLQGQTGGLFRTASLILAGGTVIGKASQVGVTGSENVTVHVSAITQALAGNTISLALTHASGTTIFTAAGSNTQLQAVKLS